MEQLRFLADESCDFSVVRSLRAAGFEVLAVSELTTRSIDRELVDLAYRENRILLTEDKDFGWLVHVSKAENVGVVLIRYPGNVRRELASAVLRLVEEYGERLRGAFVLIQPGYVRIV